MNPVFELLVGLIATMTAVLAILFVSGGVIELRACKTRRDPKYPAASTFDYVHRKQEARQNFWLGMLLMGVACVISTLVMPAGALWVLGGLGIVLVLMLADQQERLLDAPPIVVELNDSNIDH